MSLNPNTVRKLLRLSPPLCWRCGEPMRRERKFKNSTVNLQVKRWSCSGWFPDHHPLVERKV